MKLDNNLLKKAIYLGVGVLVAAILAGIVTEHLHSKNNHRFYLQGLEFVSKKDYQNAYYNFSSVGRGNEFYCPSKYRAALAAENLYDKNSAVLMYKDVISGCSGTIYTESSNYNSAKIFYEQKNYKKAESLFTQLLTSAETEKYQIASNYFLGQIETAKASKKALGYYLKYLELAPLGRFSKEAIEAVEKSGAVLNSNEHFIVGLSMFKNEMYKSAKVHFLSVPLEKSWYYLAVCAAKAGDYKQSKSFITKGLPQYSGFVGENELHAAIDMFASYFSEKKAGYMNAVNMLVPKALNGGDYALYKYIETLPSSEKLPYYHRIVDNYPKGRFASDAIWNLIYNRYKKGDYKQVIAKAQEHAKLYPHTAAAARVLFFAGKASEKSGQYAKAKGFYLKVLELYPDDYYAFRAKLLLNGKKTAWTFKGKRIIHTGNSKVDFPINQLNLSAKDKEAVNLLVRTGDFKLIEELLGDDEAVKSFVEYKEGNKTKSIVLARNFLSELKIKPEFNDTVYKLSYPLYYVDLINKYAHEFDLDPYIVISIMREESYFDTSAKSYVGAGGLMQIMPDTAKFIAEKYNLPYSEYTHNNIDSNIRLGCAYLDYALSELSKKYLFAVAGYNGGHNAVKNWHNTLSYKDFDEFVEEIPYSETQTYIRKVFKSYWNYLNVYDKIE